MRNLSLAWLWKGFPLKSVASVTASPEGIAYNLDQMTPQTTKDCILNDNNNNKRVTLTNNSLVLRETDEAPRSMIEQK